MYILGIGPEFLPTAIRVDYIDLMIIVANSFFVLHCQEPAWRIAAGKNCKKTEMNKEETHMNKSTFILKGNICYTETRDQLTVMDQGYLVCHEGISRGVYPVVPEKYRDLPVTDYHDLLIVPGMSDLHVHAPQYPFRGLGMDLELLDWLNTHTFPEESRYADPEYAEKAYRIFTEDLRKRSEEHTSELQSR